MCTTFPLPPLIPSPRPPPPFPPGLPSSIPQRRTPDVLPQRPDALPQLRRRHPFAAPRRRSRNELQQVTRRRGTAAPPDGGTCWAALACVAAAVAWRWRWRWWWWCWRPPKSWRGRRGGDGARVGVAGVGERGVERPGHCGGWLWEGAGGWGLRMCRAGRCVQRGF